METQANITEMVEIKKIESEMRKLWCDVYVGVMSSSNFISACSLEDKSIKEFEERFNK
jgi:hypothetical protein